MVRPSVWGEFISLGGGIGSGGVHQFGGSSVWGVIGLGGVHQFGGSLVLGEFISFGRGWGVIGLGRVHQFWGVHQFWVHPFEGNLPLRSPLGLILPPFEV
jgi:hypothetical protein